MYINHAASTTIVRNVGQLTDEDKTLLMLAKSFSRPHGTGFLILLKNRRLINWYPSKQGEAMEYLTKLKIPQTDVFQRQQKEQ
jgi:hypothetical protein